jgi:hypothetical protein
VSGTEHDLLDAAPALLRLDAGPPALVVWPDADGNVPTSPDVMAGYVRWYGHTEWPKGADGNALDGASTTATTRWYIHCVAATEYSAAGLADRVRTALLDVRPTVTGRSCGLVYMEASELTNRSELAGTPTYVRTVVYAMVSVPG